MNFQEEDRLLRQIAGLVAQKDFRRDIDHKQNLLDCIALLLSKAGLSNQVDVW